MRRILLATAFAFCVWAGAALADPVKIVAAENFYGDIASQIGGSHVNVVSILSNPDQDPHLFEASASTAKDLADAQLVIVNGVDYDPWMEKLLKANKAPQRKEILIAALTGHKAGDNPHLWYDPAYVKAAAHAVAVKLIESDPANKTDYENNAKTFNESVKPLEEKISALRQKYSGQKVAASEPVFGYMAGRIGLQVAEEKFALAVMNNTEPSASAVAGFERDLKEHKVKVMLFNAQASEPAVQRLVQIAKDNKVPIVGVSETEPAGKTYQEWMLSQLDVLDKALAP